MLIKKVELDCETIESILGNSNIEKIISTKEIDSNTAVHHVITKDGRELYVRESGHMYAADAFVTRIEVYDNEQEASIC